MKHDIQNKSQKYTIAHETAICSNPPTHNFTRKRKTEPILNRLSNTEACYVFTKTQGKAIFFNTISLQKMST